MRNQHVIFFINSSQTLLTCAYTHYYSASNLKTFIQDPLIILSNSFMRTLSCGASFPSLHPGHVDSCHDEVDADVRQEGSDAMTTVPQVNFISYPLLTCERKYK